MLALESDILGFADNGAVQSLLSSLASYSECRKEQSLNEYLIILYSSETENYLSSYLAEWEILLRELE